MKNNFPVPAEALKALRILLVEDNEHDRIAFIRAMRHCAHPCTIDSCERAAEALERLAAAPAAFDLVVVDYNLPGDNGLTVCRTLLEGDTPLPVVLLTGSGNEQVAVAALKLGIADYIIKDPAQGYLQLLPVVLPQIARTYHAREAGRQADGDLREAAERLAQIVNGISVATFVIDRHHTITHWNRACEVMTGTAASEVLGTREQWRGFYPSERPVMADLILDNAISDDVDRFYHGKFRPSALIDGAYEAEDFFTNFGDSGRWLFFTAAPIHDAQGRVVGAIETLQDVTERRLAEAALKESEARFRALSITDGLTGLYNARHFFACIETEISRATRHAEPLCLLLMDVDNFKRFNDSHGHLEGDRVLTMLAASIRHAQRASDSAFRYGGEEFVVLLPTTRLADALTAAERLRQHFAGAPIAIASGALLHASVSIGVAQWAPGERAASFIRRADEACYQAKHAGKNCVVPYRASQDDSAASRL
jgi:diguanylate cyclase (GGDEF)-like protein